MKKNICGIFAGSNTPVWFNEDIEFFNSFFSDPDADTAEKAKVLSILHIRQEIETLTDSLDELTKEIQDLKKMQDHYFQYF